MAMFNGYVTNFQRAKLGLLPCSFLGLEWGYIDHLLIMIDLCNIRVYDYQSLAMLLVMMQSLD